MEDPPPSTTLTDLPGEVLGHIAAAFLTDDDLEAELDLAKPERSRGISPFTKRQSTHAARYSKQSFRTCCRTCWLSPALQPRTLHLEKGDSVQALLSAPALPAAAQHVDTLCLSSRRKFAENLVSDPRVEEDLLEFFEAGQHCNAVGQLLKQVTTLELKGVFSANLRDTMSEQNSLCLASLLKLHCPGLISLSLKETIFGETFWYELAKNGLFRQLTALKVFSLDATGVLAQLTNLVELDLGYALVRQACVSFPHLRKLSCRWFDSVGGLFNNCAFPSLQQLCLESADLLECLPKYTPLLPKVLLRVNINLGSINYPPRDRKVRLPSKHAEEVANCLSSLTFPVVIKCCHVGRSEEESLVVLQSISAHGGHQLQELKFNDGIRDGANWPPLAEMAKLFPCLQLLELDFCTINDSVLQNAACAWQKTLKGLNVHLSRYSGFRVQTVLSAVARLRKALGPGNIPLRVWVMKKEVVDDGILDEVEDEEVL